MSNIPLELWSHAGLCWLASSIGIPLQIDPKTARMENLSFAKMCVEVGVDEPFPSSIVVHPCSASTEVASVNVDYSWKPTRCARCHQIGHLVTKCMSKFVPGSSHPKPLGSGLVGLVLNENVYQFRMPPPDAVGNSGHLPCSVAEEAKPMDLLPCPGIESEDGRPQSEVNELSIQTGSPTQPSAAPMDAEDPCGCSGSRPSIVEQSESQTPPGMQVSLKPVSSSLGLVSLDSVVPSPYFPVSGLCIPDPSAIAPDPGAQNYDLAIESGTDSDPTPNSISRIIQRHGLKSSKNGGSANASVICTGRAVVFSKLNVNEALEVESDSWKPSRSRKKNKSKKSKASPRS